MILLYHETATDSTITTPARLGREHHSPRRYQATGHFLALDGEGHVIAQDAEEICKIPGWRLATPQEQNAYHKSTRGALHEDATDDETSAPESAKTEQASDSTAPTRDKRRK